jgi:hypothetical protein
MTRDMAMGRCTGQMAHAIRASGKMESNMGWARCHSPTAESKKVSSKTMCISSQLPMLTNKIRLGHKNY